MEKMDNVEMARVLSSLAQLDINAVYACDQAIPSTELISLRDQLREFRNRHYQHVVSLGKVITALGVIPPEYSPDFKGYLMEGLTAVRGSMGIEGALKAMMTNEEHIMKKYREASALPFTPSIKELVDHHYRDVQGHVELLQKMLTNRVWEKAA